MDILENLFKHQSYNEELDLGKHFLRIESIYFLNIEQFLNTAR